MTAKTSILMCPPDYFGIEYEINPWMSISRRADASLARRQWEALYGFFTNELSLNVRLVEPRPGLPDMVFTANAGIVRGRKFILSNFRNEERKGEMPHFEAWFEKDGYSVYNLHPNFYFEGEGDMLFAGGENAYAGYLIRSDADSHAAIAELLGIRVVSLELADPRFYHLDTCFCPLSDESLVYYPGAFDPFAREVIEANFPDRIEIGEPEALQFVCNALVVGCHYVQPKGGGETLRGALESRGYIVHEFDMSEFMKAGGAVKCLVLKLGDFSEEAMVSTNWGRAVTEGEQL